MERKDWSEAFGFGRGGQPAWPPGKAAPKVHCRRARGQQLCNGAQLRFHLPLLQRSHWESSERWSNLPRVTQPAAD